MSLTAAIHAKNDWIVAEGNPEYADTRTAVNGSQFELELTVQLKAEGFFRQPWC